MKDGKIKTPFHSLKLCEGVFLWFLSGNHLFKIICADDGNAQFLCFFQFFLTGISSNKKIISFSAYGTTHNAAEILDDLFCTVFAIFIWFACDDKGFSGKPIIKCFRMEAIGNAEVDAPVACKQSGNIFDGRNTVSICSIGNILYLIF